MAQNINLRHFIHTVPMVRYALMLLAGIVIAEETLSAFSVREWLVVECFLIGLALIFNKRHAMMSSVFLLFGIMALGGMRYSFYSRGAVMVKEEHCASLDMVVASEPIRRGKTVQFDGIVIGAGSIEEREEHGVRHSLLRLCGRRLRTSLLRDTVTGWYEALHIGKSLRANVDISPLKEWHGMAGNFDYIRWQKIRGIAGRGFIGIGKWEETESGLSALGFWERQKLRGLILRERLLGRMKSAGMSHEAYAVMTAMALGNKGALTPELREEYGMSGASHILALSGMHLSIIYMLLTFFLRNRKKRYRLLVFACLWSYVIFVGMPLSVVRAALMLTIWEVIWFMDRDQRPLNVFGLTLAVMLLVSPESLWDVGFQMSFMAVLGIIAGIPVSRHLLPFGLRPIKRRDKKKLSLRTRVYHRTLRGLWDMAVVSISAQSGTIPLAAYYFGRVSVYFLMTNFIVIPCATVIICGAFVFTAMVLADIVFGGVLSVAVNVAGMLLSTIVTGQNTILSFIAHLPGASIENIHISMPQVMASYIIIYALLLVLYRLVRAR